MEQMMLIMMMMMMMGVYCVVSMILHVFVKH